MIVKTGYSTDCETTGRSHNDNGFHALVHCRLRVKALLPANECSRCLWRQSVSTEWTSDCSRTPLKVLQFLELKGEEKLIKLFKMPTANSKSFMSDKFGIKCNTLCCFFPCVSLVWHHYCSLCTALCIFKQLFEHTLSTDFTIYLRFYRLETCQIL